MTSPKLRLIQRQMERRTPERIVAPETGSLGAQIEALIANEVASRVTEAVERTPPPRVRDLFRAPEPVTDYRDLPPTPHARSKTPMSMKVFRDGADKIVWVDMNGPAGPVKYKIIRDGAGLMIGAEEISDSPVLPGPVITYEAEARQYNPGESR